MPGPSNQWTDWAIDQRPEHIEGLISRPQMRLVLIVLASYSDRYGMCRPSIATLSRRLDMKHERVSTALSALQSKGLIRRAGATSAVVAIWQLNPPTSGGG